MFFLQACPVSGRLMPRVSGACWLLANRPRSFRLISGCMSVSAAVVRTEINTASNAFQSPT
eukprot:scaffold227138_cov47-Prasinocladus_malaysianus.AAC.2